MFFVDGHCDTLTVAKTGGEDLFSRAGHINLEKLARFAPSVQVFAIWLTDDQLADAYAATCEVMDYAHAEFAKHPGHIRIALSRADVAGNIGDRVCSAILGAEGGEPIGSDMGKLHSLYAKGLRVLTLTWNRGNNISGSIACPDGRGLTAFGREVLGECERLGILVDVSHISTAGFWDVARAAKKPFFASHSNCRALASHRRNLDDSQIRAIADCGGVVGVNLYDAFLSDSPKPGMDDVVRHLQHLVNVGGQDCAALGGDLDGIPEPTSGWFTDVTVYEALYHRLTALCGASLADKIFRENSLRVFAF
ncbi:MAG: dipeptidase [Defluviitaleaceae bacterium]|nr:dipeptidase [Defluviitaleaceae bacterium]